MIEDNYTRLSKLIASAWTDTKLKKRLIKDPNSVLKEAGIKPAARNKVKVLENTAKVTYIVIPRKPKGDAREAAGKKIANFTICFGNGDGDD